MTYPAEIEKHANLITAVLKKICGDLNIRDEAKSEPVRLNKERFLSPEFKELWDKIKYKTTYRVNFDSAALLSECVKQLADENVLTVTYPKYILRQRNGECDAGRSDGYCYERFFGVFQIHSGDSGCNQLSAKRNEPDTADIVRDVDPFEAAG